MANQQKLAKIKEIRFSCSAHATEDVEKVKIAILNILPIKYQDKSLIKTTPLIGHAGNPIYFLEMEIKNNKTILEIIKYLSEKIETIEKEFLYKEINNHLSEDNCFYLRFNKDEAYKNRFFMDEKDNTIKLIMKFIIYKQDENILRTTLEAYGLITKA